MKKGFTLLEVLTAVAIIAIVAAISFPVIARAKDSAYRAKSISNMRQVHIALEIYTQENNGSSEGTMEAMGLPPWPSDEFLGPMVKELYPPMRPNAGWRHYMYLPIPSEVDRRELTWGQYTQQVGSSAVVICDPFFNPERTDDYEDYWKDPYVQKFVMGMTISGSLVKRTRAGHLTLSWWMD
jgi:prepilin-type N-terminal cleavage/methylation domain-containing protein